MSYYKTHWCQIQTRIYYLLIAFPIIILPPVSPIITECSEYSTQYSLHCSAVQSSAMLVWLWRGRSRSPNSWHNIKRVLFLFAFVCDPICDLCAKYPDIEGFDMRGGVIFLWCRKWMWSITWCNVFILSINFGGGRNPPQSNMKCHY